MGASDIWPAIYALIDDASVEGVLVHELGPLAAQERRAAGKPVPEALAAEERAASFAALSATALLKRIREICAGPLVLLKGPEVAALYPPNGRRFGDVDVLTPQATDLHRSLLEHGFLELDKPFDFREHHHLTPLRWPVVPLSVEVHLAPNWPPGIEPPPLAEILEAAVPSVVGAEGLLAPRRLHHVLLLAAHAWAHVPLGKLRELLDVHGTSGRCASEPSSRATSRRCCIHSGSVRLALRSPSHWRSWGVTCALPPGRAGASSCGGFRWQSATLACRAATMRSREATDESGRQTEITPTGEGTVRAPWFTRFAWRECLQLSGPAR